MMPGGTENLLPTIVDIECTMVDHVLEAMLLYLMTLPVDPWPLLRLEGVLDLRRAPIHQSLARNGLDDHKVAGLICAGLFPGPAIDPCAYHLKNSGLKAPALTDCHDKGQLA